MPTGPRPYVANGLQITAVHTQNSQPCVCTFGYLGPPAWTFSQLNDLVAEFNDHWITQVMPLLAFNCVLTRTDGRGLRNGGDDVATVENSPPVVGGVTQTAYDNQQATVISKRSTQAGKQHRGRVYVPGLASNSLVDGLIPATYRNALAAAVQAVLTGVKAVFPLFTPSIISYEQNNEWRPTPLVTPIVTCQSRTSYPGSMNNRRP